MALLLTNDRVEWVSAMPSGVKKEFEWRVGLDEYLELYVHKTTSFHATLLPEPYACQQARDPLEGQADYAAATESHYSEHQLLGLEPKQALSPDHVLRQRVMYSKRAFFVSSWGVLWVEKVSTPNRRTQPKKVRLASILTF